MKLVSLVLIAILSSSAAFASGEIKTAGIKPMSKETLENIYLTKINQRSPEPIDELKITTMSKSILHTAGAALGGNWGPVYDSKILIVQNGAKFEFDCIIVSGIRHGVYVRMDLLHCDGSNGTLEDIKVSGEELAQAAPVPSKF